MDSSTTMEPEPSKVHYSWQIAFIYVFNLIVGAGALTLPKAFAQAGWVLSIIALSVLAMMSYCTSTFMVEAMSIANGVLKFKARKKRNINEGSEIDAASVDDSQADVHHNDTDPMLEEDALYDITTKVEMGEMARIFYHKIGLVLYYLVICLYLYGDLAIYAAAVPKSMTTTVCGDPDIFDHDVNLPCENVSNIRVIDMYRIMLVLFTAALCPFVFFNIGKTKFLQIFTTIFRWAAFITMIVLALVKISNHEGSGTHPKWFNMKKLPNFFGVAVYSFMCQHSLPSILTPVRNKKRINLVLLMDFILTASFYALVALTAVFAFPLNKLEDLYTLNFRNPIFLRYFLELFPVFTLSTNFPIIGITLRENLKTLFLRPERQYGLFVRRYLFPLMTIVPPITIAYCTYNVGMLVSITGTCAGALIQYIIPVTIVYCGRKYMKDLMGVYLNVFRSPFRHNFWVFFIIAWYVLCFVFVLVDMIGGGG